MLNEKLADVHNGDTKCIIATNLASTEQRCRLTRRALKPSDIFSAHIIYPLSLFALDGFGHGWRAFS